MEDRYIRQIILPQIGIEGQKKLQQSRIAVVGAGGLVSPVLYYLVAAGIGHITIIDQDIVSLSNLNRQILHTQEDIGREKVMSAGEKLQKLNPNVQLQLISHVLSENTVKQDLAHADVVLCCVDNIGTRRLLAKSCHSLHLPLIDGGIDGFCGYILCTLKPQDPCYNCVFPKAPPQNGPIPVLGSTAGVIGSMMANECIKYLLGLPPLKGMLVVDLLHMTFDTLAVSKNPQCSCNHKQG